MTPYRLAMRIYLTSATTGAKGVPASDRCSRPSNVASRAAASGRECGEMEVGDLAVAVQARGCCIAKAGSQRHVFRPEQFEVRGVTVAGVKQRHAVPDWSGCPTVARP